MGTSKYEIRVCDRCGAQTSPLPKEMPTTGDERMHWRFVRHGCKGTVGEERDLCPKCYAMFELFMEGDVPTTPAPPTPLSGEGPRYAHR